MLRRFSENPFRLPTLRPYMPAPDDPRIFSLNLERNDVIDEVVRRIIDGHLQSRVELEYALADAAYQEVKRLESSRESSAAKELERWRSVLRRVGRMSPEGKLETLRDIVTHMTSDVVGNFDPRVYNFSSRVVPAVLAATMNPKGISKYIFNPRSRRLDDILATEGPLELIRRLTRIGTVIVVPTHSSNLDSVAIGWAVYREGLPPLLYGAGKNLFTNPILSFFMHNLGAYRIDRRIKAKLYKEVVKTYSTVMLERGFHALFFPGGKRGRSGAIERKLKLGLAGTGIEAFSRNQVRGIKRPMFFIPATINYPLVLEAETLIEDHLKDSGQGRYIIEDDEFSRIDRWLSFFSKLTGLETACVIRFGAPMDPFGNAVDEDGRSLAPGGRIIDPASYVMKGGVPTLDTARDEAYTRELGRVLGDAYVRETVVMSTWLVAHVLFRRLIQDTPDLDLFGRLRIRGEISMPVGELYVELSEGRDRLLELEKNGRVHVSMALRKQLPETILQSALDLWNGYHTRMVARRSDNAVVIEDPTLLLYYQNRMIPFAESLADEHTLAAAREIALMEAHL